MSDDIRLYATIALILIFIVCLVDLLGGTFLNALRHDKGQPKKKRNAMIMFDLFVMFLCIVLYSFVGAA